MTLVRFFGLVLVSILTVSAGLPALAAGQAEIAVPPTAAPADGPPPVPGGPLFTPDPAPMAPPCHFCSGTLSTSPGGGPSHWGHGPFCNDARNDARAQLEAYVDADCASFGTAGRCAFSVIYTSDCYAVDNVVVVDAYATYRCWVYYC